MQNKDIETVVGSNSINNNQELEEHIPFKDDPNVYDITQKNDLIEEETADASIPNELINNRSLANNEKEDQSGKDQELANNACANLDEQNSRPEHKDNEKSSVSKKMVSAVTAEIEENDETELKCDDDESNTDHNFHSSSILNDILESDWIIVGKDGISLDLLKIAARAIILMFLIAIAIELAIVYVNPSIADNHVSESVIQETEPFLDGEVGF